MKEFILYLLKQIVSKPESVEVIEGPVVDGWTEYKVKVDKEDMGIVIGKEGRNIKGIRSLVRAKAIKDDLRVRVELVEDENTKIDTPVEEVKETTDENNS